MLDGPHKYIPGSFGEYEYPAVMETQSSCHAVQSLVTSQTELSQLQATRSGKIMIRARSPNGL